MPLYPTVEDMTVADMSKAQVQFENEVIAAGRGIPSSNVEFMGENVLAPAGVAPPAYSGYQRYQPLQSSGSSQMATAHSTGAVAVHTDHGLANYKKAEIHEGVRNITIIPDAHGKVGLRVKSVSKGIFVQAVITNLPAAKAGLRFGDQLLSVNGTFGAGFSSDKAHNLIKEGIKSGRVDLAVRERPFERTIVLKKSSDNHLGFEFKHGKIKNIRKESSAARNGLLINHNFVEVNGQNVVHMADEDVHKIIANGGESVTLTIVPKPMFDIMCKNLGATPLKLMDHSIPEL